MTVVPMRPDAPKTNNPFRHFHELGWPNLLPLMPADAQVSPRWKYVHQAIQKHGEEKALAQMRGKAPAVLYDDGKWGGFKWREYQASEADYDLWHGWGANVGFRMPPDWVIFDIDITDEKWAQEAEKVIVDHLGPSPCRIGLAPKRMLFYRLTGPVKGAWVFTKLGGKTEAVEMFTDGRQVALFGMHRGAGRPYQWPRKPTHRDDITLIRPDQYEEVQQALLAALPEASSKRESTSAQRETIPQESLRGDPALVRKAMSAIPNNRTIYPSRDDYIRMGAALKAALPDDEDEAFHLWTEWAEKDDGGKPEIWRKDWNGLGGTFAIGANWIYAQADKHGDGSFSSAEIHFDPVEEREPSPFDLQAEAKREDDTPIIEASAYTFPDPASIPKREWIYGTHLIRKFVSATVAPSGVGKSSLVIAEAVALASGKPLLGIQPKGPFRVWLWNGEDPIDELQRRVAAVMLHYGLSRDDIGDRLFLDSGRDLEIVLAHETRDGATIAQPVVKALTETLTRNRIDVMQVDPFVSSHRVSENDNGAIDLVSKQWAKIANATGCAIDLVHHVRKLNGAEITVEDSRGAVSLIATSRSARALAKMQKNEAAKLGIETRWQRFFRFGDGKSNLAPPAGDDGRSGWMELVSVGLGNGAGSGLDAVIDGDSVGVVVARSAAEMEKEGAAGLAAVLGDGATGQEGAKETAVRLVREAGVAFRRDIRAGDAWVGVPIARALRLDITDKTDRGKVNALIAAWLRDGTLVEITRPDAKRMPRTYVEVAYKETGVFD